MTSPPTLRTRALAVAATLALTCALVTPTIAAADDLRDQERQAERGLRGAEEALQESSDQVSRAQSRLEAARGELDGAQQRLESAQGELARARELDAQMAERLRLAEAELEEAEEELEKARAQVRSQRADIGRLAASMYANGDPDLMGLSVLFSSQDPAQATSRLNTADALMNRHDVTLERLRDARSAMVAQEARVTRAVELVTQQREQAAALVVEREQLEAQAGAAANEVRSLVGSRQDAERDAKQVKAADRRALAAAEQQAAEIKQLILERAAQQRAEQRRRERQQQRSGSAGGSGGSAPSSPGGFLQRPVPGGITSPYGYRTHPIYGYYGLHDGTDFSAPCGTANVAAGAGTVIARQYSDVFGNRLYLDLGQVAGNNVTVVYNHLSGYAVGDGQQVSRGQTIGYSGDTGWSTGCHLHFTVLENGSPVDPMKYL